MPLYGFGPYVGYLASAATFGDLLLQKARRPSRPRLSVVVGILILALIGAVASGARCIPPAAGAH